MLGESLKTALMGLLLAAWLVAAAVAIWKGLSMQRAARASLRPDVSSQPSDRNGTCLSGDCSGGWQA